MSADGAKKELSPKSRKLFAKKFNSILIHGADFVVDKVAIEVAGKEVAEVHDIEKEDRKELDEAMEEVIRIYFPKVGPIIAYSACLTATLSTRYEFDEYEPEDGEHNGERQGRHDTGDGEAGPREEHNADELSSRTHSNAKVQKASGPSHSSVDPRG